MVGDSWQNPERRANDKLILETCSSEHELPWFNWMMNYSQFMQGIWVRRVRIQWIKKNGKYIKIPVLEKHYCQFKNIFLNEINFENWMIIYCSNKGQTVPKKIHQMLGSTKGNIRIRTVLIKLKCVCVSVNIKEKAQRAISLMKTSQSTWSTSLVQW